MSYANSTCDGSPRPSGTPSRTRCPEPPGSIPKRRSGAWTARSSARTRRSLHGDSIRDSAYRVAVGDPAILPPGSILVLVDNFAEQTTRTGINILDRVKGYFPAADDGYWMKTDQDGTVVLAAAPEGGKADRRPGEDRIEARLQSCGDEPWRSGRRGIPVWGVATVVARPDGGFTIVH